MNRLRLPARVESMSLFKTVAKLFNARCATADSWLSFQQTDVHSAFGEQRSNCKPANTSAYYHNLVIHVYVSSRERVCMRNPIAAFFSTGDFSVKGCKTRMTAWMPLKTKWIKYEGRRRPVR